MACNETLPEFATDFLGNEICVGDTVVYPTGGTSCRMVRAVVRAVRDFREHCYQTEENTWDRENGGWIKTHKVWRSRAGYDGHRGPIAFKIVVNRQQDGTRTAGDPDVGRRGIDDERKVTLDQLHRVVSVSALERKARQTHVIEVEDDVPWHGLKTPVRTKEGELPPLDNVPLWGDGDV